MTPDPRTSLATAAEALAAAAVTGFEDLYLERVQDVWWRRDGDGWVSRHELHREGSAARLGDALRSTDGTDRLAIAGLLDLPSRLIPPVSLPQAPTAPELEVWPGPAVASVRWRWSVAAVLRDGVATRIDRPALAELTLIDGSRDLSLWPPSELEANDADAHLGREARAPDGSYPILLGPGAAAALIHEVVGHRLEADVVEARTSSVIPLGETLFSFPIDVVDDPNAALPGSFVADDEGVLSALRPLLQAGAVAGILADRQSAARYGVPAGSARRGGLHAPPRPRISNLMTTGPGRSVASLRRAARVEVEHVEAATLEAAAGVVWLAVRRATLLRRGRPIARAAPFTLRGTLSALREGLLAASRDRRATARPGWCRKHGEVVATGAVTPWLLVEGLTVS